MIPHLPTWASLRAWNILEEMSFDYHPFVITTPRGDDNIDSLHIIHIKIGEMVRFRSIVKKLKKVEDRHQQQNGHLFINVLNSLHSCAHYSFHLPCL